MVGMSAPTPATRGAHDGRANAREDVLAAAARLFGTRGFAGTSTREIAHAVGIKQASLYYHFASKDAMLAALLDATVTPSIDVAEKLGERGLGAAAHLGALALADARLLAHAPHNAGALYGLPEVARGEFAEFRRNRAALRATYLSLAARLPGGSADLGALAFALVEAVPALRADDPDLDPEALAARVATAALLVAGLSADSAKSALTEGREALEH